MSEVSEGFREFLYFQIENIDRLRILLLIYKEQNPWTVEAVSARLYIPIEKVQTEIRNLQDRRLVSFASGVYLYNSDPLHDPRVEEMAKMDQRKPVTLINMVYDRSTDRLRSFADAFKLKKKEP